LLTTISPGEGEANTTDQGEGLIYNKLSKIDEHKLIA
jgi:hypothetical protein